MKVKNSVTYLRLPVKGIGFNFFKSGPIYTRKFQTLGMPLGQGHCSFHSLIVWIVRFQKISGRSNWNETIELNKRNKKKKNIRSMSRTPEPSLGKSLFTQMRNFMHRKNRPWLYRVIFFPAAKFSTLFSIAVWFFTVQFFTRVGVVLTSRYDG